MIYVQFMADLHRHSDYATGAAPPPDAFFEDAKAIDFKSRRVCAPLPVKKEAAGRKVPSSNIMSHRPILFELADGLHNLSC